MKTNLSTSPCPLHQCRHCGTVMDPMVSETVENMQLGEPALLKACELLLSKKGKKILDERVGKQSECECKFTATGYGQWVEVCDIHKAIGVSSIQASESNQHDTIGEPTQDPWEDRLLKFMNKGWSNIENINEYEEYKQSSYEFYKDFISKELQAERHRLAKIINDNSVGGYCKESDLLERLEKES